MWSLLCTDSQVSQTVYGNREEGENLTLKVTTDLNIENAQKRNLKHLSKLTEHGTVQSWSWGSDSELCSVSKLTAAQTACVVVLKGLFHWEYINHCSPPASAHGTLMNSFAINFKRSPTSQVSTMTVVWRGLQESFYKFPGDTRDKQSKAAQEAAKYWYLHFDLLQFINGFTYSCTALHRGGEGSSNSRGGKLTQTVKASKQGKYFLVLVWFWGFFVEAKGMAQISVAEHCGSGRKGAAPSSKLKQVKKHKQDGYSHSLSHPSQARRFLQQSHCAKQFAL